MMRRARWIAAAIAMAVVGPAPPGAQADSTGPLDARIAALERRAQRDETIAGRAEALALLAEARLQRLAVHGDDITAMYGLLSREARERVGRDAAAALEAIRPAAAALRDAIETVERDEAFSESEELQTLRTRLAVDLDSFRRPMARARAALLLTAIESDPERRRALAQEAIAAAEESEPGDTAWEAWRLVNRGGARLASAASAAEARAAADDFEAARALVASLPALDHFSKRTAAEAALGGAMAALAIQGPAAAMVYLRTAMAAPPFAGGEDNALLNLIAADAALRFGLAVADRSPPGQARRQAMAEAFAPHVAFLEREGAGLDYAARRALAFERLEALEFKGDARDLPALAAVARSRRLEADGDKAGALAVVESFLSAGAAPADASGAEVMWRAASLRLERAREGGPQRAANEAMALRTLVNLLKAHAEWPLAGAAAEAACALGLRLSQDAPGYAEIAALCAESLRIGLVRFPASPDADQWRISLAALLERSGGASAAEVESLLAAVTDATPSLRMLARSTLAQRELERANAGSASQRQDAAQRALAHAESAFAAAGRAAAGPAQRGEALALCAQARAILGQADAAADLLHDAAELSPSATLIAAERSMAAIEASEETHLPALIRIGRLRLQLAEQEAPESAPAAKSDLAAVLARAGDHEAALALYEDLVAGGSRREDWLLGRAEALFALNRREEAFAAFREIAESLDAESRLSAAFWRSWRRMLETLAENDAKGERTARILSEIERLRRLDPDFGGNADDAAAFRAIEARLRNR